MAKAKHKPTAKAKKAYYGQIVKAHSRLTKVLAKHDPAALQRNIKSYK